MPLWMELQHNGNVNGPTLLLGGMLPTCCRGDGPQPLLLAAYHANWLRCTPAGKGLTILASGMTQCLAACGHPGRWLIRRFSLPGQQRLLELPSYVLEAAERVFSHI